MSSVKTVRHVPGICNIELYGDTTPWRQQLRVAALGDLTNATINAKFQPNDGALTDLLVETDPAELLDSTFTIGYDSRVPGSYDIEITPSGSTARTYLAGTITKLRNLA